MAEAISASDASRGGVEALSLVIFSGAYDRVHFALAMAAAARAVDRPATLFFTMGATRALLAADASGPGWHRLHGDEEGRPASEADAVRIARGVAGFEELLSACVALSATVMVCEMGLRAMGLELAQLRPDVPVVPGGLVTLLTEAPRRGALVFV